MHDQQTYGDTSRDFYRRADIVQALHAAAVAAEHYADSQFRRGYLAAVAVIAAAHGIDLPRAVTVVEVQPD